MEQHTILWILAVVALVVLAEQPTRSKRQQMMYLCGLPPNQHISLTPCTSICKLCKNTVNLCRFRCKTDAFCSQFNPEWRCHNGCCALAATNSTTMIPTTTTTSVVPTTTTTASPICGGRELSDGYCRAGKTCSPGFLCTTDNVCCRCAYGTSMGSCVDGKCPANAYCSPTNNCCPFPNLL